MNVVQILDTNWESQNWESWRERYHLELIDDVEDTKRIEVLASRSGQPTVRVLSPNGRPVFLHSSVDPVKEAARVAENLATEPGVVVLVYGLGLGYLVEALLDKLDERIPLFVVEPDRELFCTAMKTRDLTPIISSKRVIILPGDSGDDFETNFTVFYDPARFKQIIRTGLSGHETVYKEFHNEVGERIKNALNTHQINLKTFIKIGPDVITSGILNLVDYYTLPGIRALFGKFTDVPAIVVAAGPSLTQNIELLHEAKGKAVILAVGTAVKALQKRGIEPDFVLSIDPGLPNYEHFKVINTEKTCLITEMQSYYKIVREFKGPRFVMGSTPISSWFKNIMEDKGSTESAGSVANNAFSAAYQMGANPIILVGQDLAYSKDGHTHAAGTNYENNVITGQEPRGFFPVPGNNDEEVLTDCGYYQFLCWFEHQIRRYPDRDYINATEGGALIKGTKVSTLREVLDEYCTKPIDVQGIIREAQESFAVPDLQALLDNFEPTKDKLDKAILQTREAAKRLKKLQKACETRNGPNMQRELAAVRKIYQQLSEDRFITNLPDWFSKQDTFGVLCRTHEAEMSEKDDFYAAIADYAIYYNKIREGAERVKELIEECIQDVERRLKNDR